MSRAVAWRPKLHRATHQEETGQDKPCGGPMLLEFGVPMPAPQALCITPILQMRKLRQRAA